MENWQKDWREFQDRLGVYRIFLILAGVIAVVFLAKVPSSFIEYGAEGSGIYAAIGMVGLLSFGLLLKFYERYRYWLLHHLWEDKIISTDFYWSMLKKKK